MTETGSALIPVPGVWLRNIAIPSCLRLSGTEWRVLALVIAQPQSLTAGRIAKCLGLQYSKCEEGGAVPGTSAHHRAVTEGSDISARLPFVGSGKCLIRMDGLGMFLRPPARPAGRH